MEGPQTRPYPAGWGNGVMMLLRRDPDAIRIRPARRSEMQALAALAADVAREAFPWNEVPPNPAEAYLESIDGEEVFVAFVGTKMAGFLTLYAPRNFIHTLGVVAAFRSHGVGQALIAHVRARVKGPLELKVEELNARALDFYERNGWHRVRGEGGQGVNENGVRWFRLRLD